MQRRELAAQLGQLFSHLTYNTLAYFLSGARREAWVYPALLLYAALLEPLCIWLTGRRSRGYRIHLTALIAASATFVNLSLTNSWIAFVGVTVAITSKFVFRNELGTRHVFNPGNVGMMTLVLLFPTMATEANSYWSKVPWLNLWVLICGAIVVALADRWRVTLGYVLSIFALSPLIWLLGSLGLGGPGQTMPMYWAGSILGVGGLIYSFHMVTDPMTTPKSSGGQWIYGASVALLQMVLTWFRILYAPWIALLLVCAIRHWWLTRLEQRASLQPQDSSWKPLLAS